MGSGPRPNGMRARQVALDSNNDGVKDTATTWRLGDVIHSTPIPVSRPSEAYHLVYRDTTYAQFVNQYKNRRQVIYFGGNDGMVHAVNGGFYDSTNKRFCRSGNLHLRVLKPRIGSRALGLCALQLASSFKVHDANRLPAQIFR